jgi:integrase
MNVSGKTKERTTNGFEQSFNVLREIVSRNYADESTTLKKLTESNDERYVFRTKDGLAPGSFNHVFEGFLEEHNLLVDPVTGRNRVFYSLRSTYATTVMNYDAVPIRDLSKQLGNSVGIIQKHYDRASGEAIVENIKAPNAKKALFNTSKVRDIYKSNKVKSSNNHA